MLQLEHICKSYTTNDFTQVALDDVSLAFRDNEFVSILGPSGSGKTTLLNVIGGLDHFDSGDLLVDGVSTREYRDRDWDAYRNNRIGFVFQSYNLIPHQTILANVELALTLSGVSATERRERARRALEDVGLGDHVDKRPSQLSGGQMQRVAIARALINDPEILLADEPTGALDSRTSVQVMDLLREVADDRLVIMVTHNPELARAYSTRIVELADGRIRADTHPYVPTPEDLRDAKPARRTSMSFLTALSLSFNNLMTKKGRTLMTAFAGSIGIIGIAAILALANGVNAYIQEVEEDTLSVYPLQIMSSGFDMTSMIMDVQPTDDAASAQAEGAGDGSTEGDADDAATNTVGELRMVTNMFSRVGKNDLASLKDYFDENGGDINAYVRDIEYLYGVVPQIFSGDTADGVRQVNPDSSFAALGIGGSSSALMASTSAFTTNVFSEMPGKLELVEDQFDVKAGRWPKDYDELVLVLSRNGSISDFMSYAMGLRNHAELERMVRDFADQEEVEAPDDERTYSYADLMAVDFRVVPAADFYEYEDEYGVWTSKLEDEDYMRPLVEKGQRLTIVGVVQAKEDVDATSMSQGIYYTPKLTRWLMDKAAASRIVKEQIKNPTINVISGKSFDQEAQEEGNDFDMSSLFSIDQDKIAGAFGMDTSALDMGALDLSGLAGALDLSALTAGMDLSGVALPPLDLSQMQLPSLDLSDLQLDLSDLDLAGADLSELFTPEVLEALTPSFANIDPEELFEGVEPTIDREKLQATVTQLAEGARASIATQVAEGKLDPNDAGALSAAVVAYFSQPSVTEQVSAGVQEAVSVSEANRQRIADNLRKQIVATELDPEQLAELDESARRAVELLREQVGSQLVDSFAQRLAGQLGEQLSTALSTSLGTVLQTYLSQAMSSVMANMANVMQAQLGNALRSTMQGAMTQLMANMANAIHIDEEAFAEAFQFNMTQQELSELMMALMSSERTSYDNNLAKLGYADERKPSEIDLYPRNFDDKAEVIAILDGYNDAQREAGDDDQVITYTDIVGALMSSVTDIVNMISYVLIAFVAISLVVSSIMIGVITYISVLERKKEIGILRSIGASKRDVSNVFNAETIIEGLTSGVMGVTLTALMCIPANAIVEDAFGVVRVARLPLAAAFVLVGVSVVLSFVAGVLPARKAAKADPVEALRSE